MPLVWGWAMDAICEHLEAITDGQITRLLINVPPGTSKSTLTAVYHTAWEWGPGERPGLRVLASSYSEDYATRDTRRTRDLVSSPWYQARWPHVQLDKIGEKLFTNTARGFRQGVPFSSLTGGRGDRVIIDDPHSVDTAESDAGRTRTIRRFRESVTSRLIDPSKSAIIVIMQRLHEQDVSGEILAGDLGYEHLCLPMEFEPDRTCATSIGFTDPRKQAGELLFPERFPADVVERDKKAMGSYAVAGQFQQRPAPRGGGMLKPHLIDIVDDWPRDSSLCRRWDFAGTKGKGDYTVGLKMAFKDGQGWIVDIWRGQVSPHEVEQAVLNTASADGIDTAIILEQEPGSSGKWVAQDLQRKLAGYASYASRPDKSKELRARPLAAAIEAGNIKMVRAAWNDDLIGEFATFPAGAHDDIVDAAADAWLHLTHGLLSGPMIFVGSAM